MLDWIDMNRKGQNITIEQMFLFTIGLIITITIYYSFSTISENIEDTTKDDQVYGVIDFIKSCAVKSYIGPEGTYVYDIPDEISQKPYRITVNSGIIKLEYEGKTYTSTINKNYNIVGGFFSSPGKFKIEKIGSLITVGRFYEY